MTTMTRESYQTRPTPIVLAVGWAIVQTAINIGLAVAWPDLEDRASIIIVSSVFGTLLVAAALWLWTGSHKGWIALLILNGVSILMAVPAFIQPDVEAEVITWNAIEVVANAAVIVLLFQPAARVFGKR